MPTFEVETNRVATGGAAIGTAPDGKICFVTGALPDERVTAAVIDEKRAHYQAQVVEVLCAAPTRVSPPCSLVAAGCGGCDWQHASAEAQSQLRREIVADCLRRIGGIEPPEIEAGPVLPVDGYRTTVRVATTENRAGFRRAKRRDVVPVAGQCVTAHPLIEQMMVHGRFFHSSSVTMRVGANTGDRMVVLAPGGRAEFGDGVDDPGSILVVESDDLRPGNCPVYHETVAGVRFQVSAPSFFQCRPDGAAALVDTVDAMINHRNGTLLDAYCGVGLFAATVGRHRPVIAVESNRFAAADAGVNLGAVATAASGKAAEAGTAASGTGPSAAVVRCDMARWRPQPVESIVADPARQGLGERVIDRLCATGALELVLVSCDPASLARDARLLHGRGYHLERVVAVDMFGHTSHVEVVSRFVRR